MSVIDKIAELESLISPTLGATALSDPANNIADPLVQIAAHTLGGQVELESKLDAFLNFDLASASCDDLDTYAAFTGESRRTNKTSSVSIVAFGNNGTVIPANTSLTDSFGVSWVLQEQITINGSTGFGVAASPIGEYSVSNGELSGSAISGISVLTNSAMIETGYLTESCEQFRERLSDNKNTERETEQGIISRLESITDSVKFITDAPDCVSPNSSNAFVIEGGTDSEIAAIIADHAPLNYATLAGNVEQTVNTCETVRFLRPCPVGLQIQYWGSKSVDDSEFINAICSANSVSALSFSSVDCVKSVMLKPVYPVSSDTDCDQPDSATDCNGGSVSLISDDCYCTGTECAGDFVSCVDLESWQKAYFIDAVYMGESC